MLHCKPACRACALAPAANRFPPTHTHVSPVRHQAVLRAGAGGQGTLSVVENNDFSQLPHLALAMRAGTDAAIKQFLAFRLAEMRADTEALSSELQRAQVRGAATSQARALARWLPQPPPPLHRTPLSPRRRRAAERAQHAAQRAGRRQEAAGSRAGAG